MCKYNKTIDSNWMQSPLVVNSVKFHLTSLNAWNKVLNSSSRPHLMSLVLKFNMTLLADSIKC